MGSMKHMAMVVEDLAADVDFDICDLGLMSDEVRAAIRPIIAKALQSAFCEGAGMVRRQNAGQSTYGGD